MNTSENPLADPAHTQTPGQAPGPFILPPGPAQGNAGPATTPTPAVQTPTPTPATTQPAPTTPKTGKLAAFEGFLKKAGHIAGTVLADVIKYAVPVASVVSIADPAAAPALEAFTASVKLVQATVISVQQRWSTQGSEANTQKLADVLSIVETPIVTLFSQAGIAVDTAYVTNLVNGVVAILNAQPGVVLPTAA